MNIPGGSPNPGSVSRNLDALGVEGMPASQKGGEGISPSGRLVRRNSSPDLTKSHLEPNRTSGKALNLRSANKMPQAESKLNPSDIGIKGFRKQTEARELNITTALKAIKSEVKAGFKNFGNWLAGPAKRFSKWLSGENFKPVPQQQMNALKQESARHELLAQKFREAGKNAEAVRHEMLADSANKTMGVLE